MYKTLSLYAQAQTPHILFNQFCYANQKTFTAFDFVAEQTWRVFTL